MTSFNDGNITTDLKVVCVKSLDPTGQEEVTEQVTIFRVPAAKFSNPTGTGDAFLKLVSVTYDGVVYTFDGYNGIVGDPNPDGIVLNLHTNDSIFDFMNEFKVQMESKIGFTLPDIQGWGEAIEESVAGEMYMPTTGGTHIPSLFTNLRAQTVRLSNFSLAQDLNQNPFENNRTYTTFGTPPTEQVSTALLRTCGVGCSIEESVLYSTTFPLTEIQGNHEIITCDEIGNQFTEPLPITLQDGGLFLSITDEKSIEVYDTQGGTLINAYEFDLYITDLALEIVSGSVVVSPRIGSDQPFSASDAAPNYSNNDTAPINLTGYTFEASAGSTVKMIFQGATTVSVA